MLFEGICTICFELEDGSRLCSLTSLNEQVLQLNGISEDGLFDLEKHCKIPETVLVNAVKICRGNLKSSWLTALDEFFMDGGKIGWSVTIENTV